MHDARIFRKSVLYLIGATRGGPMRLRIISELMKKPLNPNMLAQMLGVDYKTIVHHLDVLRKNNWVVKDGKKYAEVFMLAFTEEQKQVFQAILAEIGKKALKG